MGSDERAGALQQRAGALHHALELRLRHRRRELLLHVDHQQRGVLTHKPEAPHTAYPMAPDVTGASGSSMTLTQATVPVATARSSAGRMARGSVTCSP